MSEEPRIKYSREASVESVGFSAVDGSVYPIDNPSVRLPVSHPFYVQPFVSLYEVRTPNSGTKRRDWKNFQHYKRAGSLTESPLRIPHSTDLYGSNAIGEGVNGEWYYLGYHQDPLFGWVGFGGPDNPTEGLPLMYDPRPEVNGFITPPEELDTLKQTALSVVLPSMKQELSAVNSLLELKDLRSLARTAESVMSRSATILQRVGRGRTLKQATKLDWARIKRLAVRTSQTVASQYLEYSFGIAPLLSDIRGLFATIDLAYKRMNRLVAGAAKTRIRHYTVSLNEFSDSDQTYSYPLNYVYNYTYPQVVGLNSSRRIVKSSPSKFHLQIEYTYWFTQYQVEHARLNAILDSLGVNELPSIIWNAIPWSFVADWTVGVNRWLDQYSHAASRPLISIRRCLWSIKRHRLISTSKTVGINTIGLKYYQGVPTSVVTETAYRRERWQPTTNSIESGGLSLKEFSLAASLAIANAKRH